VFPPSPLHFTLNQVGSTPSYPVRICNVQVIDIDGDGANEALACDARLGRIMAYRRQSTGAWSEEVLACDLLSPAHATAVDLDLDGDLDLAVAELGDVNPSDEFVGRVTWLENVRGAYKPHRILQDVRRVADVQPGDLDGDGDIDLAVAVFGYLRGQVLWLENRGSGIFREHELLVAPGAIHVPVDDFDGDGDLDIVTVVSQHEEEIWGFENLGEGQFRPRRLWFTPNFDIGSAGLVKVDLDSDGDQDLLLPVGDNFEDEYSYPQPYHGCLWFENRGNWDFAPQRIATFGGTYAAAAGDLDGDSDKDVVLVSMFNDWDAPGAASVVWLENDGRQRFQAWQVAEKPNYLVAVACGDLNDDGRDDIVAGGMYVSRTAEPASWQLPVWLSD
jgi:hypothetical protein